MSYIVTASNSYRTQESMLGANFEKLLGGLTYKITWEKFKGIVKRYGFEIGYQKNFVGHGWQYNGENMEEEEIIFYNRENGLVLYANSFNGDSIQQATLYGEIQCDSHFTSKQKDLLSHCRTLQKSDGGLAFSMEVRKGFKYYVKSLEELFKFNTPWNGKRECIMQNYMEREEARKFGSHGDTESKLQECNEELREIMRI